MPYLKAPFTLSHNVVASTEPATYVEEMIEQVLFVRQGERVNRPTFGCGLEYSVFDTLTSAVSGVTEHLVQNELQAFVGDLAEIISVRAQSEASRLEVTIVYNDKLTGRRQERRYTGPAH